MESLQIKDLFSVRGRIALVTGGSSGIGYMIARSLVENGAKVYIVALPTDDIKGALDSLNSIGKNSGGFAIGNLTGDRSFEGEVSTKEGITAIVNFVEQREKHLDILASNAGIRRDPPKTCDVKSASLDELQASLWSSRHSDWQDTFSVNVTAHYFLSVGLLKLLAAAADLNIDQGRKGRDEGRGTIIVTSSCASMHNCTNIDLTSYAASKAATDHLVRLLASKYASWYVRVNSINPGFVPSKMNPVMEGSNQFANLFKAMPAARIGRAHDIGGTVVFLCSEAGSYIDGTAIVIDGGRILLANGQ
ncbi:hypothetical protein LTR64_004280 [Lithohypha guttulata]|uniref:Uncharacterized protein n=1 Tax=Lithohypha guttulata TaxID=1690604 RepID=A0AAN7YJD4_9EURO|nr:hypothetical protein LTR51_006426 [Lithohypha guttulata]KAK5088634.1 hypothetical protein LTR05_002854 [Lithohypha guttulata]